MPEHDVLVTNPPYSADHVERCLTFAVGASIIIHHPFNGAFIRSILCGCSTEARSSAYAWWWWWWLLRVVIWRQRQKTQTKDADKKTQTTTSEGAL